MQTWIYHRTEQPKIIDSRDLKEHLENGWAESPAEFTDLSKVIDMGNETEVQMVGEVMDEMVTRANDALAAKTVNRKRLCDLAQKYGVDSDEISTPNLRKLVIEAANGNSD